MADSSSLTHVRWREPIPPLRRPTLVTAFEGWNDAGDAATIAARFLARQWHQCRQAAEIDPEPFFDFTSARPTIRINKNAKDSKKQTREILWPANELRAAQMSTPDENGSDVVVMLGTEPHLRWRTFCEQVIRVAQSLQVENVITLGALLADVPHTRDVKVYGTTEDASMQAKLSLESSSYEGPTGIVGVLAAALRDAGFATVSFWASVPSYLQGARSPKAALALVRLVADFADLPVRTDKLESATRAYESEATKIVNNDDDTKKYLERLEKAWGRYEDQGTQARTPKRTIPTPS